MTDGKRKRSPNWLRPEKKLLIELLKNHFYIVENKKTDGVTVKKKQEAWQTIADEYNKRNPIMTRSVENVKSQWETLKKTAKKEVTIRKHLIQTGGPLNIRKVDPLHNQIISMIKASSNNIYIDEEYSQEDSDSMEMKETASDEESMFNPMLTHLELKIEDRDEDESEYTSNYLHTNQFKSEEPNGEVREKNDSIMLDLLRKKKIEALAEQNSRAASEHKLTMKIKKEQLKHEKIKTKLLIMELRLKRYRLARVSRTASSLPQYNPR